MKLAKDWKDFEVIATGDGEKLEKWGNYVLLRPDPQVIWHNKQNLANYDKLDAHYKRSSTGGGAWEYKKHIPEESCRTLLLVHGLHSRTRCRRNSHRKLSGNQCRCSQQPSQACLSDFHHYGIRPCRRF